VNGCNYCLTVHSFTAEHMAKVPANEIILARKGHTSDPKRDTALQFARKVIETRGIAENSKYRWALGDPAAKNPVQPRGVA
jgi:alkylhydroperoxidase family enzyme